MSTDCKDDISLYVPYCLPLSKSISDKTQLGIYELLTDMFGDQVAVFDGSAFAQQHGYRPSLPSCFVLLNMLGKSAFILAGRRYMSKITNGSIELLASAQINLMSFAYEQQLAIEKLPIEEQARYRKECHFPHAKCLGMGFSCVCCKMARWSSFDKGIFRCPVCLFHHKK